MDTITVTARVGSTSHRPPRENDVRFITVTVPIIDFDFDAAEDDARQTIFAIAGETGNAFARKPEMVTSMTIISMLA